MSTMVEQMLDLARGAAEPGGRPAGGPVDLAELGRAAVAKMAARAGERGVRVTVEAPERAVVTGEALAIGRALDNVVENAVAYTPAGGTVSVAVRRRGGHVEVAVSDTGIGIAAADLPHITEAFYRGDRARGVHPGGAGLGLTIAKATMDAHRGAFEAASRPGSGTTITLRFPAA
jgi:signal transduction histidine kinase